MDFRLTFEEGQAWLFVKLTSYPDKVNADQHIREGQGISKKPHAVVKRNAWFRWYVPPDSVRFSIDFEENQKVIVSEGHILPLTRSMPIRTSVKVSVEDNSW